MHRISLLTSGRYEDNKYVMAYHLEIQEAAAWKVIRGNLYHWYDMRFKRWHQIVGWFTQRLHKKTWKCSGAVSRRNAAGEMETFEEEPWEEEIPWVIRQDLRCFEWNRHPVVFRADLTKDEFAALGGRVER